MCNEIPLTEERLNALRERVHAGVELLDDHHPGWWTKINLDSFDINSCERCVLGQLYKDFHDGCVQLQMSIEGDLPHMVDFNAEAYGFDRPEDLEYEWFHEPTPAFEEVEYHNEVMDELGVIWAELIKTRQEEARAE